MTRKVIFGLVFCALSLFTLMQSIDLSGENKVLYQLTKSNSANAECAWWETCIESIESIKVTCTASTTVTVTYYKNSAKSEICGTGVVQGGTLTITSGYSSGYANQVTHSSGCAPYQATRVNCPTNGNTKCTEYNPCWKCILTIKRGMKALSLCQ